MVREVRHAVAEALVPSATRSRYLSLPIHCYSFQSRHRGIIGKLFPVVCVRPISG